MSLLKKKRKSKSQKERERFQRVVATFLFLFVLVIIINVVNHIRMDSIVRKNSDLKAELNSVERDAFRLTAKLEKLENSDRIARIASRKLGMVYSEKLVLTD